MWREEMCTTRKMKAMSPRVPLGLLLVVKTDNEYFFHVRERKRESALTLLPIWTTLLVKLHLLSLWLESHFHCVADCLTSSWFSPHQPTFLASFFQSTMSRSIKSHDWATTDHQFLDLLRQIFFFSFPFFKKKYQQISHRLHTRERKRKK